MRRPLTDHLISSGNLISKDELSIKSKGNARRDDFDAVAGTACLNGTVEDWFAESTANINKRRIVIDYHVILMWIDCQVLI